MDVYYAEMHEPRVDWNHLRTALAIERTGNLSRAAKVLGINQSTASRHLATLESEVGSALFSRSRSAMLITEAGRIIVAEAEAMESAMRSAFDRVGTALAETEGLVRVVAVPWIVGEIIVPQLIQLWRQHPRIEVQVVADTRERLLEKREVDLSLRFDPSKRADVEKIAVGTIVSAVYAGRGMDPDELPWMGFREDEYQTAVEAWLLEVSGGEPIRFWANDAALLRQAVRSGAGKALLPVLLGDNDPELRIVSDHRVERTLWVQVLPQTRRLRRISLFVAWLQGLFGAPPEAARIGADAVAPHEQEGASR